MKPLASRRGPRILGALGSFALLTILGCAGILGVPDLTYDVNAPEGHPDGSSSSNGNDASSSGGDGGGLDGGGLDAPTTCNADLKLDPKNCGACGHDCTNGVCKDGLCSLTDLLGGPEALAVKADTLYIGLIGEQSLAGIISCPTNGCYSATVGPKQVTPADAGYLEIQQMVMTATDLYASDYYGTPGGFLRVSGSTLTRLASGGATPQGRSYGLALDNSFAYWVESESPGNLWWCTLPCAGSPQLIKGGLDYPEHLVLANDGSILYSDGQGYSIRKCNSKADCANPVDIPKHPGSVNAMVLDGTTLYWAAAEEIMSCTISPTVCANATSIVTGAPGEIVTAIAVSGTQLYYSILPLNDAGDFVNTDGVVKTCPIASCAGAGIQVLATKQASPSAIALDAKSVYWANDGRHGYIDGRGNVMKAPR